MAGLRVVCAAALLGVAAVVTIHQHNPATRSTAPAAAPSYAVPPVAAANAFYATGPLDSVDCRQPQAALSTPTELRTYDTNLLTCLNNSWGPKVRSSGAKFTAPRIIYWTGDVQSPCASAPSASFYCASNQTLYLSYSVLDSTWRAFTKLLATDTISRLYAYHVQQLTGILAQAHQRENLAANAQLEQGRRVDLEASCLSGAFIGANLQSYGVTRADVTIYLQYVVPRSGPPTPPGRASATNRRYWAERGLNTHDVAACNTFTAPPGNTS
ncbi:neutral zinc metallopeptidase [Kribbella sp. WER1]